MARRAHTDVSVDRVYRNGVYVRTSTVGHTGDRAFLLVPGIGVSSNYFERLAFQLNEFGPVIALDLPGFGGVPHPKAGPMSIAQYADLVAEVIDDRGLADPIVVGHSMGTQIVAELATRRQLSDLVLLSPVVNPHERRPWTAFRRFVQSAVHEPPKIAAVCFYAYLLCGPRWFSRVLPVVMRYRIEEVLPRITANTLVVAGERDALCPRSWVQEVAELLPQAQVWMIPDAAHSVMHGNAEDVAHLCIAHARRSEPDDDVIRTAPHDAAAAPDPRGAVAAKAVHGRVTEFLGVVTDDDDTVAKGKTKHAEAIDEAASQESD
jgi:pimeloyl-ACP methyl ester carboxylesterase